MPVSRRLLLQGLGAGAAALAAPAIVRAATQVRVGYLHTLAVDGQIWLADHLGTWKKQGLDMDFRRFTTGLELFQALIGGSIDMLATGAVISNFPARGQGKAFLINDIEFATAQLWANPAAGVTDFAALKGKKISTTRGTTAHVFLDKALRAHGLVPDRDVEIVNQRMSEAVTSFISGAVPAVALWLPFNVAVKEKLPGAKMLVDASAYYPETAIVGGWAADAGYLDKNAETLRNVIRAWVPANDFFIANQAEALKILHDKYYTDVPLSDLQESFAGQKMFSSRDWAKLYADGTVAKWLDQVTDFYVSVGGIQSPVHAKDYFVTSLYLDVVKA